MGPRQLWSAFLLLVVTVAGCAPRATTFVRPDVDFGRINRCAVIPFRTLGRDQNSATRVESVFLTELLRAGAGLVVVESGATAAALRELRLDPTNPLSPAQVVELGKKLGAEGVFSGTVMDCGAESTGRGRVYVVTAEFVLTETETGTTIWRSEVHGDGFSLWRKLFGGESASLHAVARDVVRKALGTLF